MSSRDRVGGPRLQPGEELLSKGRPRRGIWLLPSDALLIPFSLMWGGFAIFWEVGVLSNQHARNTVLFPIWGVPFVLVGLYLIAGRFFVRHWMLGNTRYAITDRRAVAITPSFRDGQRESTVWLRSYPQIDKRGNSRRGTLYIGYTGIGPRSLLADPAWPMFGSRGGVISRGRGARPPRPPSLKEARSPADEGLDVPARSGASVDR